MQSDPGSECSRVLGNGADHRHKDSYCRDVGLAEVCKRKSLVRYENFTRAVYEYELNW